MKVGDLIRLRLPHMDSHEIAIVLKKNDEYTSGYVNPDPTDVWWEVLLNGEPKEIHQDYVREVINEGR